MQLKKFLEFRSAMNTLKEVSKDDSNYYVDGETHYLSEDLRKVIDFDCVKTNYLNELKLSEEYACSVDALFRDSSLSYFVEFKNGKFSPDDITRKAKDSLLLFSNITELSIGYCRENAMFLLVVNDDRIKKLNPQQNRARALANKGEEDFVMYGLSKLRGFCYKRVALLGATQFEKWIAKIDIKL